METHESHDQNLVQKAMAHWKRRSTLIEEEEGGAWVALSL